MPPTGSVGPRRAGRGFSRGPTKHERASEIGSGMCVKLPVSLWASLFTSDLTSLHIFKRTTDLRPSLPCCLQQQNELGTGEEQLGTVLENMTCMASLWLVSLGREKLHEI